MRTQIPHNIFAGGGPLLRGKVLLESPDGDHFVGICPDGEPLAGLIVQIPEVADMKITRLPLGRRYEKPVPYPLDAWTASLKAGV